MLELTKKKKRYKDIDHNWENIEIIEFNFSLTNTGLIDFFHMTSEKENMIMHNPKPPPLLFVPISDARWPEKDLSFRFNKTFTFSIISTLNLSLI